MVNIFIILSLVVGTSLGESEIELPSQELSLPVVVNIVSKEAILSAKPQYGVNPFVPERFHQTTPLVPQPTDVTPRPTQQILLPGFEKQPSVPSLTTSVNVQPTPTLLPIRELPHPFAPFSPRSSVQKPFIPFFPDRAVQPSIVSSLSNPETQQPAESSFAKPALFAQPSQPFISSFSKPTYQPLPAVSSFTKRALLAQPSQPFISSFSKPTYQPLPAASSSFTKRALLVQPSQPIISSFSKPTYQPLPAASSSFTKRALQPSQPLLPSFSKTVSKPLPAAPSQTKRALQSSPRDQESIFVNGQDITQGSYEYRYKTQEGTSVHEAGQVRHISDNPNTDATRAVGGFSYIAPDGTPIELTYVADENGFHPKGSHLPTSPPIPEAILRSLEYIRNARAKRQTSDKCKQIPTLCG